MLKQLHIRNYALIESLELEPNKGLNIITGETGAGKSILLGAIGLMLGNRADAKVLFNEEQKCIVEGTFDVSNYALEAVFEEEDITFEKECIIRREIAPGGKSRAFINDTPVKLESLKKIVEQLLDVHSQHDTFLLGSNAYQIGLLDAYASNQTYLLDYKSAYSNWKKAEKTFLTIKEQSAQNQKEYDFNLFLFNELDELKLQLGEQEEQEAELKTLENAEEIKSKYAQAFYLLNDGEYAITSQLKTSLQQLESLSKIHPESIPFAARLKSAFIEIKDIADEIEVIGETVEYSPARIELIQNRLSAIYRLQKKHAVNTVEELIAIYNELDLKIQQVQQLDEVLQKAETDLHAAQNEMLAKAQVLSNKRQAAAPTIQNEIQTILGYLGMTNAVMEVTVQQIDPTNTGIDKVSFLFSANKGIAPQELKNAASGGEFSRLMLAVKYVLAGKTSLPSIIFDEIDTGISGEIAKKVGALIKKMSTRHQVMCITHMPQMAAKADAHFYVYKDNTTARTVSNIRLLEPKERVFEIAQMIGGNTPSEADLQSARGLIEG
ncbi:MAG: repair protein RecN [Bacteroidota bacterium]|jgi:DNA repair protein RecN (Recombination protein N)